MIATRSLALASLALLSALPASKPVALADGVTLIPGGFEPGHQPDGNTVVFRGSAGLVVLDTGRHPAHSQAILDFAASRKQDIVAVVNSHWHLDHVSGNPRLRAAYPGLIVYASSAMEGAMHGFLASSKRQAAGFLAQADIPESQKAEVRADLATIDSGKAIYPDVEIESAGERVLAGRRLQLGLEHNAVTAGDVLIYDPTTRTLATGDLVTLPVPFLDTACPANWSAALGRLDGIRFERLVPGHGAPMDRKAFATYRVAFDHLLQCADSGAAKAECEAGWIRDARPLLSGQEQEPGRLAGLLDYYIDAVLRDKAKRAALCAAAPA